MSTIQTKKWKLDELSGLIDEFDSSLADSVHKKLAIADDYPNIVLWMAGKSIVTFREIVCLCTSGYPDGALSLARNLYEQLVTLYFLNQRQCDKDFQNYIEDYFIDYDIQRYKAIKSKSELLHRDCETEKWEEKIRQLRAQSHATIKGTGQFWWTGKRTFFELVTEVQEAEPDESMKVFLAELYRFYKLASASLHAGCYGNMHRLGNEKGFYGVDASPTARGHGLPLYFATCSFIPIVGVSCNLFHLDYQKFKNQLNELALFYKREFVKENDAM